MPQGIKPSPEASISSGVAHFRMTHLNRREVVMPKLTHLTLKLGKFVNQKSIMIIQNHLALAMHYLFFQAKIAKCCIIWKRLQGHVPAYLKAF